MIIRTKAVKLYIIDCTWCLHWDIMAEKSKG